MQGNFIKRGLSIFLIVGMNSFWMGAIAQRSGETTSPQTLPFSQPWDSAALIATNDDWSNVPGIVGYLGDYLPTTSPTNVDPRTVTVPMTTVDVIANQADATNTSGGVAEIESANTVALQGSGTADAPNIIIYLNTTGQSNIRVQYDARDVDSGAEDAVQQIATQYRVGSSGNYINVPGGYIADATTGGAATLSTHVDVTLPAAANNQPVVEVRILTTNAGGSDEWVGIDNITVTNNGTARVSPAILDFDGDTRTDYVVARDSNGVTVGGFIQWFVSLNGTSSFFQQDWGLVENDDFAFGDYDGDGKTDFGVWRKVPAGFDASLAAPEGGVQATFYYVNSSNGTIVTDPLGLSTDEAVVGDYNGDGKSDTAVMRNNGNGTTSWYYRPTPVSNFVQLIHGGTGSRAVGDYDGDGKNDTATFSNGVFTITFSSGGTAATPFGNGTDMVVPGDYDGDKKTDLAVTRFDGANIRWDFEPSATAGITTVTDTWGLTASDYMTPGDYNGDGKTDYGVWRDAPQGEFFVMTPVTRFIFQRPWGLAGDFPVGSVQVSNDSFKAAFK